MTTLVPGSARQRDAVVWVVRQMGTFRVFGGRDPVNRVFALLGFGRYFAGALWATYRHRR